MDDWPPRPAPYSAAYSSRSAAANPSTVHISAIQAYFNALVPGGLRRRGRVLPRASGEARGRTGAPLQGNWRHKAHLLFTWVDELVHHPRILDAAEDVLGPVLLDDEFLHQGSEQPRVRVGSSGRLLLGSQQGRVMTTWVALSPANLESGCMNFLPGSQTRDHLQHVDTFHKDNLLSRGQEIAVTVDDSRVVDCILNPGEMSLHHVKLVHGSEPNRSNERRMPGDPLHPDRCEAAEGARFRDTGARRGSIRQFRPRAPTQARPRRGCARRPCGRHRRQ
jgi:Phytanoyl-CoA dioxygenase (PhyH)